MFVGAHKDTSCVLGCVGFVKYAALRVSFRFIVAA